MSIYSKDMVISESLGMYRIDDITFEDLAYNLEKLAKEIRKESIDTKQRINSVYALPLIKKTAYTCLNMYMQILSQIEEIRENNPEDKECYDVITLTGQHVSGFPVKTEYNPINNSLVIDTPAIFMSNTKERYNEELRNVLYCAVEASLVDYLRKNQLDFRQLIKPPVCIYLLRRVLKTRSSQTVPDNDNIAVNRIINAICQSVMLVDSYRNMVWLKSGIELVDSKEEEGTTFVIIEEKNCLEFEKEFIEKGHKLERIEKV